jgi:hypothetical protein
VTGPNGLTNGDLTPYGLGAVVRDIRVAKSAPPDILTRLYCLLCGIAIDHHSLVADWWICGQGCNA